MVGLEVWYAYAHNGDDAPSPSTTPSSRTWAARARAALPERDAFARKRRRAAARRWLLLGGPRSGTGVHVDPLYTHAWVYLVQGGETVIFLPSHLSRDEWRPGPGRGTRRHSVCAVSGQSGGAARHGRARQAAGRVYVPAAAPHSVESEGPTPSRTTAAVPGRVRVYVERGARVLRRAAKELPSSTRPLVRCRGALGPRDAAALVVAAW